MAGQAVKDAQWLLAGHNRFVGLAPYKDGVIDGDYGPLSAQATARAKFWLGYPDGACTPVFNQTLYEYANYWRRRPLPDDYKKRRDSRVAAAAVTPGLKAFREAEKHIGYKESPANSNMTMFGKWYGWNGVAWCAIFESYCFAVAGFPRFRYAAVELIHGDAAAMRNGLRIVRTPQQGDVVGYSFGGDTFAHTAFFDRWVTPGRVLQDLGGNTGPADFSNGGEVLRQSRDVSLVHFYARAGG